MLVYFSVSILDFKVASSKHLKAAICQTTPSLSLGMAQLDANKALLKKNNFFNSHYLSLQRECQNFRHILSF